jgi:site-specific recombinase XerD
MSQRATNPLLALVQSFFVSHLRRVRGASEHTIRAYRDGLRLFFLFLAERTRRAIADLRLDDIQVEAVLAFLQHVESVRGNSAVTRNCRLAAIRSLVEHLLRHDLSRADQYGRILAVPTKKTSERPVQYLEPEDVRAVVAQIDGSTPMGRRDRALVLFLYNTGARVAEALTVRHRDLQLERPRQVRLFGKGRKERICPLWSETVVALRPLVEDARPDEPIFRNARSVALTRDGVAYLIAKHVRQAAKTRPVLRRRHITPHVLRHSCAVALLQAGVDVSVIRDYLGHASIATTSRYLTTNLDMKRKVLQAFWKRAGLEREPGTRWKPSTGMLAFLQSL